MSHMIPFIDLIAQRGRIQSRLDAVLAKVIAEGRYIAGPEVAEVEAKLAEFGAAKHALTCANGTDALLLPLMTWSIGPGDAVFVPSFTFASTAEVVALRGATAVFVDIDPDTYCMDPKSLSEAIDQIRADGEFTPRVVIAVDMFGQPADYPAIRSLCEDHGLKLIADSAQGFGCTLNGKHPVYWADIATISFYPAKPLGCYGDGGAVVTNDDALATTIRSLKNHGEGDHRYAYAHIGLNSRLDTIQAAVLLEKLAIFKDEITARNVAADHYATALSSRIKTPSVIDGGVSTWAQYTVETEGREDFQTKLSINGVPTAIYYPIPLHKQPPYSAYPTAPNGLPATERAASRVISLPMDAYLGGDRQAQVIAAVDKAVSDA